MQRKSSYKFKERLGVDIYHMYVNFMQYENWKA